ncbi:hypothetical protein HWV62_26320 [Athelia sp. TMB]|nr:hypothetical protein HWV62_26320 [Athelia sp. TMB]
MLEVKGVLSQLVDLARLQAASPHIRRRSRLIDAQACSRRLHAVLSLASVWRAALNDIRAAVADPDDAPHALSSAELQRRVMRAARIERHWGQPAVIVSQRDIRTLHIPTGQAVSTVIAAQLVNGGEWIVLLAENGALCLRSTQGRAWRAEELSFVSPVDPGVEMTLGLLAGARKETLVLLSGALWDEVYVCSPFPFLDELTQVSDSSLGSPSTTIAIYLVDTSVPEPCFRLLSKATQHHSREDENLVVAEGSLWAFGFARWPAATLHQEYLPESDTDASIQASLSLLSETQLLITSSSKSSLYAIPPLLALPPRQPAPIIRQAPLWSTTYQDKLDYPPASPVCWARDARLAVLTGTTLRFFTPPRPSMSSCWIRTYSAGANDARPALSGRRAIWSAGCRVFVCTFPSEAGGLRLGAEGEMVRVAEVVLPAAAVDRKIVDLSWDEAAGRLCLLVGSPVWGNLRVTIIDTPALENLPSP